MASETVSTEARKRATARSRGPRYYTPSVRITDLPGVERCEYGIWFDEYRGTAEQLSAAGLLPLELFPGQPGCNSVSATYRPIGVARLADETLSQVPRALTVHRSGLNGRYRIVMAVAREERKRRRDAQSVADNAADRLLREIPSNVREYLEDAIRRSGSVHGVRWYFHNAQWLEEMRVMPAERRAVLDALTVYQHAQIERELMLEEDFRDARALLVRIARR